MQQRPENDNYDNWCYRQQKNKPQVNSILGPLWFMFISGTHMAWGIATPLIRIQEWHLTTDPERQPIVIISWYIGALIGSVILLFINQLCTKKILYIAGGVLYAISSALMVVFPQHGLLLLLVRLLAGIGHGLVFISALLHGAENSHNKMRPQVVGSFNVCILGGMLVTLAALGSSTSYLEQDLQEMNMFIGIMNTCFSVLGIVVVLFLTRESVVTSIQNGDDETAINNMARLRREPTNNAQLIYDVQEIKEMIKEDEQQNLSPFQEGNSRAMVCIVLMRVLYVLGFNYAFNMSRVVSVGALISNFWVAPIIGLAIRSICASVMALFADMIGRKPLLIFSAAASGVCLAALAICSIVIDDPSATFPGILFLIFDGAIGLGVSFLPDVLMSEAFPIKKKFSSAMVGCILEYVLQIIIIGSLYTVAISEFEMPVLITSAVVFLAITGGLFVLLPKVPSKSTLRETRAAFRSEASSYNQPFERDVSE